MVMLIATDFRDFPSGSRAEKGFAERSEATYFFPIEAKQFNIFFMHEQMRSLVLIPIQQLT